MEGDRALIFHMCIPCYNTFPLISIFFLPNNVTLTLIFDVLFKNFNIRHNFLAHLSSSVVNFYIWHLLCNPCTEFHETLQEPCTQGPVPSLCFFFRADQSTNMATEGSDWLTHFRHLLCNHCTEFHETLQEASTQGPLPSLYFFSCRSVNKYGNRGFWLADTFSTSLQALHRI